jgi:hypothetical protein
LVFCTKKNLATVQSGAGINVSRTGLTSCLIANQGDQGPIYDFKNIFAKKNCEKWRF